MEENKFIEGGRIGGKKSALSSEQAAENSTSHGVFATPSNLFRIASDDEKEWTMANFRSLVEEAPFEEDAIHKRQLLWEISINMLKIRRGNDYIAEHSMVDERVLRSPDGYPVIASEEEQAVVERRESRILVALNRLKRTNTKTLKELDMFNYEADSTESVAVFMSNLRKETDEDSDETSNFATETNMPASVELSKLRNDME